MKVEKINNNKAMIVLTLAELTKRKITLKDIKEGAENVQDFFFEI
ncbi:MAG: adaptor protein MecA [Clostridia bacterium]|nr:adaptor protein MecA [Clostridia bacterium]